MKHRGVGRQHSGCMRTSCPGSASRFDDSLTVGTQSRVTIQGRYIRIRNLAYTSTSGLLVKKLTWFKSLPKIPDLIQNCLKNSIYHQQKRALAMQNAYLHITKTSLYTLYYDPSQIDTMEISN